jgi:tetratricopeptide (TPR) repeat protein
MMPYLWILVVCFLSLEALEAAPASDLLSNSFAEEIASKRFNGLFNLPREELLKKGSDAEAAGQWDLAVLYFNAYLSKDPDSRIAARVKEELENIRWRSKILSDDSQTLEQQRRGLEGARLLYELGLYDFAALQALELMTRFPDYWQNSFLAASAFLRMGQFDAAKDCLAQCLLKASDREKESAMQLMVLIHREQQKGALLQQIADLVKESSFRKACQVYQKILEDNPEDAQIRQSAIQTAILAAEYDTALKWIQEPLRLANGRTVLMPEEVRSKLTDEIKKLKKGSTAQTPLRQSGAGSNSKPASESVKPKGSSGKSPSMAEDFLKRIKK